MADRLLMVTWGEVARGMEARAIDVFNEALGILGRWQQAGDIDSFDVALMEPNGSLDGYIAIKGSAGQLATLRESDEFRRNTVDATLCVDDVRHIMGFCNEGVADSMAMFREAAEALPQS